jgi:hypothetical protein
MYAMRGAKEQAARAFTQASQLILETRDAELSNEICWAGSTNGYAREVLMACEYAVELEPENGKYRDSRGLARALTGNNSGAIEDFEFYVMWSKQQGNTYETRGTKRASWIKELQKGQNPFDRMTLRALRNEAWNFRQLAKISWSISYCGAGVLACIVRSRSEAGTTRIDQVILARLLSIR